MHTKYFVYISDPSAAHSFQLPYSLLNGEKVRLQLSSQNIKTANYHVKLTETISEANDGSCVGYPTQKHQSYSECVDAELREKILPALGCMVPWMSKLDYCDGSVEILPKHEDVAQMLFDLNWRLWGGVQYKTAACPLPCTLLSAHATFQHSGTGYYHNALFLDFGEDIKTENILLAYDLSALLVEIGSSLGLWLGKPYKILMSLIDIFH